MRRSWPRRVIALALVLSVTGCASGETAAPPTPSPPATTEPSPAPSNPLSPVPSPTGRATTTVQVFFSDLEADPCSDVRAVSRVVSATTPLRGALEALLAGPTAAERAQGLGGWFTQTTDGLLLDVRIDEQGRALVGFDRSLPEVIPNASSSCGSMSLLATLDATVTQFPDVVQGVYSLDGDRTAFYGWLQMAAPGDTGPPPPAPTPPPPEPEPEPEPVPAPEPPTGDRAVPSGLLGTEWTELPTSDRVVALTFDGGANADGAVAILDTLASTGTPATFFLTGNWVVAYPSHTATIGDRHPVGNHTRTHPDLTKLPEAEVRTEVLEAHDLIVGTAGRNPRPWFRFPYGARDAATTATVNDLGYGSVRWTTDTLGWKGTSDGQSTTTVVERVMNDLRPGQIVLLHLGSHPHDDSTLDADALPELIRRIRAAGYGFVDLDGVLG